MKTLAAALAVLLWAAFFTPAKAQNSGIDRATVVKRLLEKHAEKPVGMGIAHNGSIIELFASRDGKTWTLIMTMPSGKSFMLGSGEHWAGAPIVPKGQKIKFGGDGGSAGIHLISGKQKCETSPAEDIIGQMEDYYGLAPLRDLRGADMLKALYVFRASKELIAEATRLITWDHPMLYPSAYYSILVGANDCIISVATIPAPEFDALFDPGGRAK
jgi:hypothetical protein|tara:strand:- start:2473 stop:3117 length:645 start_codon:yes stop_codon:yes gene_type:complete